MPLCRNCGKELAADVVECPRCGVAQDVQPEYVQPEPYADEPRVDPVPPVQPAPPAAVDQGGFLWGLLGCCIPLVGLILFLVWKDTKPKTAKAAGIGALVCVICYVVYFLFLIIAGSAFAFLY